MGIIIRNYAEFESYKGKDLGYSNYHTVTQDQINQFADATLDHQWIHTDVERAKKESPYKTTIAHGFLTLSLLPHFWTQIITVKNSPMMVNYGLERLRFPQPVFVGSQIRAKASLLDLSNLRGITKAKVHVIIEQKGQSKPALMTDMILLYKFENKD